MATEKEFKQSTFTNVAIIWAVDHIEHIMSQPPTVFEQQNASSSPHLPLDMWRMIAEQIDEHVTFAAFEMTCKTAKRAVDWEKMVRKCWTDEDLQKFAAEISSSEPAPNWKKIFKMIYEDYIHRKMYMCPHCGGNHYIISQAEWDAFAQQRDLDSDTSAYSYHCICARCDAGSWGTCSYYPTYNGKGEASVNASSCSIQ